MAICNNKKCSLGECDQPETCTAYVPVITNADRIRAMNDEELAKHLVDMGWDCHFCTEHLRLENEPLLLGGKCDEKCAEHCLKWLQQTAEDR